ncbi:MAG: SusC/RagA family TonB-linked outer membrane protein [Bacteroides sp.]
MNHPIKLLLSLAVLLSCAVSAFGQGQTVTGVVTSAEDHTPIIQAVVMERGTMNGTVTDADGHYTITVAGPQSILVFTFTGMETQEVVVGAHTEIPIEMRPGLEEIDQVMVVAFGKAKKSAFTGSATSVSSKELERKQVSSVVNALQGKLPGVVVFAEANQPGKTSTMRIRGTGSFSASSKPLYVVDGVPYDGDIAAINPQDVETTTVLKDAASASLYGARGANGVVLITTKSGQSRNDVMNVNLTAKYGYNFRGVRDYDRLGPREYIAKAFEAYANSEPTKSLADLTSEFVKPSSEFSPGYFPFSLPNGRTDYFVDNGDGTYSLNPLATNGRKITDPLTGQEYWLQPDNWTKEVIRPDSRQEYSLSLSGHGASSSYFFSGGYLRDKGYISSTNFERYSSRLKGDYQPKSWLHIGANAAYTYSVANEVADSDDPRNPQNPFAYLERLGSVYPLYVRDGNGRILKDRFGFTRYDFGSGQYPGVNRPGSAFYGGNPLAAAQLDLNQRRVHAISLREYVDFIIPYGFKVTLSMGHDFENGDRVIRKNALYGSSAPYGGEISHTSARKMSYNLQQLLTWEHSYADVHHVDVLVGHEFYSWRNAILAGSRRNMYSLWNRELNGAIGQPDASSYTLNYRTEGYLGRAQYNYDERYFISASYRRDASSRFAKQRRWGNFWSVGASWLISSERFMQSTKSVVDMLKLKASYGVQGNDNIWPNDPVGNFYYQDIYQLRNLYDKYALFLKHVGRKTLTWETSHNLNTGIEFELLGRRLTGQVEFFARTVTDMLIRRTPMPSSGVTEFYDNVGAMRNLGIDFELRGVPYQSERITWSLWLNGSHVRSKILKLPPEFKDGYMEGTIFRKVGESFYASYYVRQMGVDENGKELYGLWDAQKGELTTTTNYYEAYAGDRRGKRYIRDASPKLTGGFGTELEAYGFDFSAQFGYQLGGVTIDETYTSLMHDGSSFSRGYAWHKDILKSWTPQRRDTKIPRVNLLNAGRNETDLDLISQAYLSVDNLTLGYTLPKSAIDWLHVASARVYVVCDNVWIFSARKGFDPRFGGTGGYKAMRTLSGGVNLTF